MPVEPAVAPPPGNRRFPLFDSLRAIAALSVLLTHVGFICGANLHAFYGRYTARLDLGVCVFFLISGFLLYRPFVAARVEGRPLPSVGKYAWRRVLRILPAYWLALTLMSFWPTLPQMWTGHSWVYYVFLQNYFPAWSLGGILPAWSLAVEASFYLALPLVALLMRAPLFGRDRSARIRSELWLLVLLSALAIGFRVWVKAEESGAPASNLYSTLIGNFDWFALGMLLALASVAYEGRPRPAAIRLVERFPSLCWAISLALLWLVATQLGITAEFPQEYNDFQWLAEHVIYALIAFFLLLPAVFGDELGGLPRRILRNRALAWLGLISYGIFLWHLPLATWLWNGRFGGALRHAPMLELTLATLAVSTAAAAASYYLVERPILRFKERAPWRAKGAATQPAQASPATAAAGEASGIAG